MLSGRIWNLSGLVSLTFPSFQNDDKVEELTSDSDKMPTASRESSRSRRSNSKTKSPPPGKAPPSAKKVNGVKNNLTPKSTKDPKLIDILSDTECKLCERKNFKLGSETLGKCSFIG